MYEETKTQVPEFFPNDLVEYNENKPFLQINGTRVTWYRPTKLQDLLELKSKFGGKAKLIAGNTEVGIETKFKNREYPIMVSITELPELKVLKLQNSSVDKKKWISIGGNVTLSELQDFLLKICAEDGSDAALGDQGFLTALPCVPQKRLSISYACNTKSKKSW